MFFIKSITLFVIIYRSSSCVLRTDSLQDSTKPLKTSSTDDLEATPEVLVSEGFSEGHEVEYETDLGVADIAEDNGNPCHPNFI